MSHGQYKFPRVIRTFLKTVQRYDIRCLEKKDIKGQIISKANTQAEDSPKNRTNEFVFTSM